MILDKNIITSYKFERESILNSCFKNFATKLRKRKPCMVTRMTLQQNFATTNFDLRAVVMDVVFLVAIKIYWKLSITTQDFSEMQGNEKHLGWKLLEKLDSVEKKYYPI